MQRQAYREKQMFYTHNTWLVSNQQLLSKKQNRDEYVIKEQKQQSDFP